MDPLFHELHSVQQEETALIFFFCQKPSKSTKRWRKQTGSQLEECTTSTRWQFSCIKLWSLWEIQFPASDLCGRFPRRSSETSLRPRALLSSRNWNMMDKCSKAKEHSIFVKDRCSSSFTRVSVFLFVGRWVLHGKLFKQTKRSILWHESVMMEIKEPDVKNKSRLCQLCLSRRIFFSSEAPSGSSIVHNPAAEVCRR